METINVYGISCGERCQRYLENLIGNDIEGKIEIWGHKHLVNIDSAEIFHQIAQKLGKTEISAKMGFVYYISVPREEEETPETFTVSLDDYQTKVFISKYGDKYKIDR